MVWLRARYILKIIGLRQLLCLESQLIWTIWTTDSKSFIEWVPTGVLCMTFHRMEDLHAGSKRFIFENNTSTLNVKNLLITNVNLMLRNFSEPTICRILNVPCHEGKDLGKASEKSILKNEKLVLILNSPSVKKQILMLRLCYENEFAIILCTTFFSRKDLMKSQDQSMLGKNLSFSNESSSLVQESMFAQKNLTKHIPANISCLTFPFRKD